MNLFAGNSQDVREGLEGLKALFPGDFAPGSNLAARADHLERINPIEPNRLAGLPVGGRDFYNLLALIPGATQPIDRVSISGAVGYDNVFLDAVAGTDAFSLDVAPRQSAVSLYQNRFSAANAQGGDGIVPRPVRTPSRGRCTNIFGTGA